jgi:hypothetical protein
LVERWNVVKPRLQLYLRRRLYHSWVLGFGSVWDVALYMVAIHRMGAEGA